MKNIKSIILVSLAVSLIFFGCNPLEDYESIEVDVKPNAGINVSSVTDSAFTLTMSSDKAGYIGYAIFEDTSATVTAINILALSYEGEAGNIEVGNAYLEEAGDIDTIIGDLTPNTYYRAFVAASNKDGVESDIQTFLVKTDDGVGPTFVSSAPSISNEAALAIQEVITLSFDEPVKVGSGSFEMYYYYDDETVDVPIDSISADGNNIILRQPYEAHAGDYLFVSWEAGAVTDLSDNPVDERISGVIDGALAGNYYRFQHENFSISEAMLTPATDSILAQHDFDVVMEFPFDIFLSDEIAEDDVKFQYENWLGTQTIESSAFKNISLDGEQTLLIEQPKYADNGDAISLFLSEGIIEDKYGNLLAESDYELVWNLGDFEITASQITPANGSVITTQMFDVEIKFDFPITLEAAPGDGKVTMSYSSDGSTKDVTSIGVSAENDSILVMSTPAPVDFNSTVTLNIAEGAVSDDLGNVNLELQDEVTWNIPKLAESIDVLLGEYEVTGVSYFDGAVILDTVVVELVEGYTDSVAVTGFFKNSLGGSSSTVYGSYDTENSYLFIPEQVIGTGDNRNYTVFSDGTASYGIGNYVLEDGSMTTSGLSLGVYDGSFGWLGYGEYLPEATWTKMPESTKGTSVKKSVPTVRKIGYYRVPKGR